MSNFGMRYRGRGGRGQSSRPGLLGAAPRAMKHGLLGSMGTRNQPKPRAQAKFHEPQRFEGEQPRSTQGLLGSAPGQWEENRGSFERQQYRAHEEPRHEADYSYDEQEQYHDHGFENPGGDEFEDPQKGRVSSRRLPPQIQRIMSNLGLTKADMEELSRLPEKDLSSSNLLQVIQNIRQKKGAAAVHPITSRHDQGPSRGNAHESLHSFGNSRGHVSDREALYDPSEPTDDYGGNEQYEDQHHYPDENRQSDAFSSFKEKWYSDNVKPNERERHEVQSAGSILRGSRGPVVKSSRWERDDQPQRPPQQSRHSPGSGGRPVPLMQHRISPPRRMPSPTPQRRHSPPRRGMTPPARRMSSPPRMPSLMSQPIRGGLLGDPHDPSTQELDLLAASISGNRQPTQMRQKVFQQPERKFPEQDRFVPRVRSISPPPQPLLQQPVAPVGDSVLHAQMKAMQVLQSEAMNIYALHPMPSRGQQKRGGGKPEKMAFTKKEAETEAAKMRKEQGRVLYLRYKAGGMDVIREEHLVKLGQPFAKVTNILLVAPRNVKGGWYQAFLELGHFIGAAAMCEQLMVRPPTVEGILIQVQRSKYKDLKLREHQMNRNFDKLLPNGGRKRRHRSLSPATSKNKTPRSSSTERRSFSKDKGEKKMTTPNKPGNRKGKKNFGKGNDKDEKGNKTDENGKKEDSTTTDFPIKKEDEGKDDAKEEENTKDSEVTKEEKETDEAAAAPVKKETPGNKVVDEEKLEILRENIEQASNMSEALLKIVQQKSTKAIISEILEYLSDSIDQLKNITKDAA